MRCATSSTCAAPPAREAGLRWPASLDLGECALDPLAAVVDLRFADQHRRGDADYIAIQPALAEQQALSFGRFEKRRRLLGRRLLGFAVFDELDALHQAHPAHVADKRKALLELLERIPQLLASIGGALGRVF